MSSKIEEKTQELCATIVAQPEMLDIRKRIDTFLADPTSKGQYEVVNTKGQSLHQKQHAGQPLSGEEIADFEKHRDALLKNPVARGFLEAQDELHEMQQMIQKYVTKTFELGRVPADTDFEGGSCGSGCGCHH
ncbi:MAG TPA: YlbF family regulator [Verrucomicrobiae bacterium]